MMNKPFTLKTFAAVGVIFAALYVATAAVENYSLLSTVVADGDSSMTISEALTRADSAVPQWLVVVFVACLIGASFGSALASDGTAWAFTDDSEDEDDCSWNRWDADDYPGINPATGLPLLHGNSGVDIGGHMYGCSD